jgi:GrpB-like predicted nucleotidyltransferase (UPF0157 family)
VTVDEEERVYFAPEENFRDGVERLFRRVEARLRSLVPNADIQHVGSTAIPGSLTKGDLDVQVRVAAADYAAARARLAEAYAINEGGFAADDATSFEDYSGQPALGVHLTVAGGGGDIQWQFRDLLRASSDLRSEYDRLKERYHGGSMEEYRTAKAVFVTRVLQAAGVVAVDDR